MSQHLAAEVPESFGVSFPSDLSGAANPDDQRQAGQLSHCRCPWARWQAT